MTSITDERDGTKDRRTTFQLDGATVSLRAAVVTVIFVGGLLATYFASTSSANSRFAVVETRQQSTDERLKRIEDNVNFLVQRAMTK